MRLTSTWRDLAWLAAYLLGTWACAAVVHFLPNGVWW